MTECSELGFELAGFRGRKVEGILREETLAATVGWCCCVRLIASPQIPHVICIRTLIAG
jgi:hypothetical protein